MIKILLLYLTTGFIHMFFIQLVMIRIKKLGGKIEFDHGERIMTVLVWPVFSFMFWYNFIRTLLHKK